MLMVKGFGNRWIIIVNYLFPIVFQVPFAEPAQSCLKFGPRPETAIAIDESDISIGLLNIY